MKTIKLDEFYDERYIPLEEMFLVAVNQYYIEHQEELQGGAKMLKVVNIISAICISGYSIIEILIPTTLSILK